MMDSKVEDVEGGINDEECADYVHRRWGSCSSDVDCRRLQR